MKVTACWDIAQCSLVEVDGNFMIMEASETSVYFNKTTLPVCHKAVIFILAAVRN
jgi:hypothetical protein